MYNNCYLNYSLDYLYCFENYNYNYYKCYMKDKTDLNTQNYNSIKKNNIDFNSYELNANLN